MTGAAALPAVPRLRPWRYLRLDRQICASPAWRYPAGFPGRRVPLALSEAALGSEASDYLWYHPLRCYSRLTTTIPGTWSKPEEGILSGESDDSTSVPGPSNSFWRRKSRATREVAGSDGSPQKKDTTYMELRECDDSATWDAMVTGHPFGHPLQAFGWGEVKAASGWRVNRLALYDGDTFRAGAQVLTRGFSGIPFTMTYVPRGPVADPTDAPALKALAEALRRHGQSRRSIFCKVDPAWPDGQDQAIAAAGFIPSSQSVQVTDTYTIDLTQTEAEILAAMRG
ncbi:MAG: hypothetical protein C5B60_11395, partial [Chloroflexi bacterium]